LALISSASTALADVNHDGYLDVVISNDLPDRKLTYLNDGKGNFHVSGTFGDPKWPTRETKGPRPKSQANAILTVFCHAGGKIKLTLCPKVASPDGFWASQDSWSSVMIRIPWLTAAVMLTVVGTGSHSRAQESADVKIESAIVKAGETVEFTGIHCDRGSTYEYRRLRH
jgi:hypothetical protein